MNKDVFGLDIGATTMKLVWLKHGKGGYVLNAAMIAPTPPKGILSESPLDEEEMARAIKKIKDDAGVSIKRVNVALAENQVYTSVVEMPYLSDRELSSAIYWEAEQHIPVPLSSISLTWNVLNRPDKKDATSKMQILMVGAPTLLINKYQKIFSMADLTIAAMETEILSTVRSLTSGPDADKLPPTLIISIGAVSTSIAIVREGVMVFAYSMQVGGAAINRAIAADFGLTSAQAEEYKKAYGISGAALGLKIGQATQPILMSIIQEVKKSIAFYTQKYNDGAPIRQIFLSGGTAKLSGIELFIANNTGIEAVIANPWRVLGSQEVPKEILDNGSDYTIAVGLAMRDE
ncbi:MAG: hypothetical protein A2186_02380 [Candidatus Levybacteria bacterium RIFOXYA1_FULL_41_10]|nr:MAG: Type IV pilus biogenesis ATPase PilM [Candidatus Levybacteria bacterium GW2011_GWA1_39_34]KKR50141.1 MAG: Type IV pilus biogenesis ATPase PilM [Candidatus Levybacteria bacterium GW2011_GWC1_40_19]KKR73141.1 MAG: Type IV pilus biogenesis ATPase PilM [Candidatus Levybacteria bacterium GW2011_GWC2_40_7]KKR94987.1 MAG: Type IV pilus biogenesis ATPase PilM [Candidatus Levybacteria bacterium GW2011_GWA2_41_15]KKS01203.1 MAG: Type IV pilus biogenesis ATPase PilM [Candidatus Levybacteria bacter